MLEVLEFEVPVLVVPATAAAQLPETLVVEQRMHPSSTPSALPPEMPAETPEPVIGSGWDQADQQEVSRMRGQAPKDKTVQTSWDEGPQGAAQQLPVSSRTPAAAQAVREAVATSSPTQETAGAIFHCCPIMCSEHRAADPVCCPCNYCNETHTAMGQEVRLTSCNVKKHSLWRSSSPCLRNRCPRARLSLLCSR